MNTSLAAAPFTDRLIFSVVAELQNRHHGLKIAEHFSRDALAFGRRLPNSHCGPLWVGQPGEVAHARHLGGRDQHFAT